MRLILVLVVFGFSTHCFAQEESERPWSVGLMIGHHRILNGVNINGEVRGLLVPSWSLAVNRKLNEHWFVGLHTDLIVEAYLVKTGSSRNESEEGNIIEREFPLTPALILGRKFAKYHSVLLGFGAEFADSEPFAVARLGYEFAYPIAERFEGLASVDFDHRFDGYNSYSLLIGVTYLL